MDSGCGHDCGGVREVQDGFYVLVFESEVTQIRESFISESDGEVSCCTFLHFCSIYVNIQNGGSSGVPVESGDFITVLLEADGGGAAFQQVIGRRIFDKGFIGVQYFIVAEAISWQIFIFDASLSV